MDITAINEMFTNIRENTDWDLNGPMLWGYFFVNTTPEPLHGLGEKLVELGYTLVEVFEPDLEEGEDPYHVLHVERAEVHTEASLDARNHELQALAEANGVEDYDGMDVGPVEI
ncbi:regulator of ribonuclease activity B [Stenotrophomonas rhizophila]|uniref:ribonuclease E inhibitor RraB n=1 Tax=Stenotrophomonas rhizophila TaxID=216778 RepID=UPI000F4B6571|nr:ribonuclease E inhibitor RraB [Stenotrophomonas rhizophila]ROP77102.1 regulator of ribonuclease activity B [Stenotrophomonas rhizophila]